jgi:alkylation response protein AidB-like acyl-CoA dehydrogenase
VSAPAVATLTPHDAAAERSAGGFETALARIAERACELDRAPRFPAENLGDLLRSGALRHEEPGEGRLADHIALVRAVAAADASTARILDGHLNGVERLVATATDAIAADELEEARRGHHLIGVWGSDPTRSEGLAAWIARTRDGGSVLRGTKVFCSGAGGVQRALVVAVDADGKRRLAYIDATDRLEIDRGWYRAPGLRASESHRVSFDDVPVIALIGGPDELTRQPFFARDGVRTSATWAGLCDAIAATAAATLAALPEADAHQKAALGALDVHLHTIDLWLEHAGSRLDRLDLGAARAAELAARTRVALATASSGVLASSVQACGSRTLATDPEFALKRRDLDLFLLQHRLAPQLEALGRAVCDAAR